jgi:outer membrane protein assembly factor BamE (lipoprotein component of BamABCDE complex)
LTAAALLLALAGCASWSRGPQVTVGETAAAVQARLGRPAAVYALPDGQEYEYSNVPFGQATWMVKFDPTGHVRSFEQVLRAEKFATIRIGEARQKDILETFGKPAEVSRVFLHHYLVWSYRYKENDVWNSMMHVHFDEDGVVRMVQNGPDPMYEDRRPIR